MKRIWDKWNSYSLILRICCGLLIGAILGIFVPGLVPLELLGTLFTSALKAIAPVLVFFLVASALCKAKGNGSMRMIIVLYICATLMAAMIAVIFSFAFPSTMTLASPTEAVTSPGTIGDVLITLMLNLVANPVEALASSNYLGILFWSALVGIGLRLAADATKDVFNNIASALTQVVRWVISMAPFGVMGLVYSAVSTSGLAIFSEYGHLIAVLVGCMLFVCLVANPILVFLVARVNPYPLVFRCLKDSAITAFFTRSSAANIPVNMELCRRLGLDRDSYAVSIPLGATINMSGAAITITVMTMAACNTLGIQLDLVTAFILSALAAVAACGCSGVPGGSLMLIPLACSLFGIDPAISAEVVGVGFIIAVVQDSFETALNSSSDVLFTATAELRNRRLNGESVELLTIGKTVKEATTAIPHAEPVVVTEEGK